jgi:hypothetical protein
MFYKRKLTIFNLTGRILKSKDALFVTWDEFVAKKKGDEVASGILKFLEFIISKDPKIKRIILWSDSCVG